MTKVISKDGTSIAYERTGKGPAVVLVDGALCYREHWGGRPLAAALSKDFSVFVYDRRGRGESGDTQPYAVDREIEDIDAVIGEAGGSAQLYGLSSGAVLALRAASQLGAKKITKLALYDAPLEVGEKAKQEFSKFAAEMAELLRANKRGDAVAFFFAGMMPPEAIEGMRQSPDWPFLEAVAPTLAYDNAVMGDGLVPVDAARSATMPTLVLNGAASPDFMRKGADALADIMPNAERKTLPTQTQQASPEVLAPVLAAFFRDRAVQAAPLTARAEDRVQASHR